MYLQWPIKDPLASKDYSIDWSRWLSPGETIIASDWINPPSITLYLSTFTSDTTTAWLSGGGQAGSIIDIQNKITTSQGRINVVTVALPIGAA